MIPAVFLALFLAQPPELRSTAADRTELGLTLYHAGYAMVRERRRVDLPAGPVRLALEGVADRLEPKTVQFRVVDGPPVTVLERNFEFDLLSPESLVKHSLEAPVRILEPVAGAAPIGGVLASLPTGAIYAPARTPIEAMLDPMPQMERIARIYRGRFAKRLLVAKDPDVVVKMAEGYTCLNPGKLVFLRQPEGLRANPALLMDLESPVPSCRSMDLAYLTQGLDWHATYVATLDPTATHLDLDAFVTLTNNTGSAFPTVHLQLLAGAPNRVPDPDPESGDPDVSRVDMATVMVAASVDPFRSERIGDNQLFTLDRPTTMTAGQTKQIVLFSAPKVSVTRKTVLGIQVAHLTGPLQGSDAKGTDIQNPRFEWSPCENSFVQVKFRNKATNGLGRPLPQGTILVNYRTPEGHAIQVLDGLFEETPEGEEAEFQVGPLAKLTGRWRLAEITRGGWFRRNTRQATFEVLVANGRMMAEPVEIQALVGPDWELLASTHASTKPRGDLHVFQVDAHPGETLVRATFRVPDPES